jgi:hypothetical protein
MDRNEFIKTLTILKTQPKQEKGFSFRRTVKTLQQAHRMDAVIKYQNQLINARAGVMEDDGT